MAISVMDHLRRLVSSSERSVPSDGELLGEFIERRDKAALAQIVARHGPMIWGVCRRMLSHHDAEDALHALKGFRGAARRFEFKGEARGVKVYDDYAHHPTEVRAALSAARSVTGEHRLHVLFQPHLFSRTREFAQEFADSLRLADTAVVLDIYPAREDPIEGVTSRLITDPLGTEPSAAGAPALATLLATAQAGDIVLTVGAGDVTAYGEQILEALSAKDSDG